MKIIKEIMKKELAICIISGLLMTSCASMDQPSRTMVGTQIGSFAGGVLGAIIGNNSNRWDGAELGATLGSLAGGAVGGVIGATSNPTPQNNQNNQNYQAPQSSNSYSRNMNAPQLTIEDIYLEDSNNNQMIEPGEDCRLVFIIVNNGNRDAINVMPVVTVEKGDNYLKLSPPVLIDQISPEDRISYSVKVKASSRLKSGKALMSIKINEGNGYGKEKETFTVNTKGE